MIRSVSLCFRYSEEFCTQSDTEESCTFLPFQWRPSEPQVSSRRPLCGGRGGEGRVPGSHWPDTQPEPVGILVSARSTEIRFSLNSADGGRGEGGVQEHHPPRQAVRGPDCTSFLPLSTVLYWFVHVFVSV